MYLKVMLMEEITTIGIDKNIRDRMKIHVIKNQDKYESMMDFVNKAVVQLIEDDEHDSNTNSYN